MNSKLNKRLFIGISANYEITPIFLNIKSSILYNSGKIQWIPLENIHLTLSFLGNISFEYIPKITQSLKDILSLDQFIVYIEKTGIFPSTQLPTIFYLGIGKGRKKLTELQKIIEKNIAPFKVNRKKKIFMPHVTIGKTKQPCRKIDVLPFLKYVYSPIELDVNSVCMYESKLFPEGMHYTVINTFPLN